MIKQKIGIIGFGNMSGAIFGGAIKKGIIDPANLFAFDPNDTAKDHARKLGIHIADSEEDAAASADIVFLGVKPQYAPAAIAACKKAIDRKAVISIMAGLTIERIKAAIDGDARVLRLMPNTPALVDEGASVLCSETDFTEEEKASAVALFEAVGIVEWVPENLISAVCGTSGGAPAWVAMFIEALGDAGVQQGLPRKTAYNLACQTVLGSAKLLMETGMHPAELKDMVTSPGGTTIEGCKVLEGLGFRGAIMDCVEAASEKSKQL
jgi:pyrroline-5-carboxylate reductase